jgi:acyl-CoA hydrolase
MEFVCFVPISDKVQQRVYRYSMTSSARPISAFGTMNALAVLRLITNSYLVGACIECDFKIPSRIGEVIDLTLLVEDIGRSSLAIAIVCHRDNIERLRARMVTAMMSLETKKAVPMPHGLREAIESYRRRTAAGAK